MKIFHILAGGPVDHYADFLYYESDDVQWVAADRGVFHLLQRNIMPVAAFGDYDSVSEEELRWMREQTTLHIMPKEKDETDLELAITWALKQKPDIIRIFGATGGRLDHGLANIQMLVKSLDTAIEMILVDHKNEISIKRAGTYVVEQNQRFPYISFLPLTETVTGITLQGFKYPLHNQTIQWGSTLCVSNELNSKKGTFSFRSGILMVISSTD
ncbi:thiamine diphosphokinase [Ectobacillus antri]|uniref:thiamine diphosphokinase n=1 Tax=Ectobacillus antri TaxID=2486280 RepID=UPI000F59BAFA|nr:thiamine diphosphokinase [Ectobacillus antri]